MNILPKLFGTPFKRCFGVSWIRWNICKLMAFLLSKFDEDAHLYFTDAPLSLDSEKHSSVLLKEGNPSKHASLCSSYNMIPYNEHEGEGWWENVVVVAGCNFSRQIYDSVQTQLDVDSGATVVTTYLPRNIIGDVSRAGGVIGFKPPTEGTVYTNPHDVVWLHYV